MAQLSPKTYIILDALDECTDSEELLALIQEMNNWRMVQMLVTSRKEKDIEEVLEPLATCQICIQDEKVDDDIQMHIRHQLQNDPKLKKWPLKVQAEIETSLMDGAHGMFRWVVCQLDALRKCLKLDKLQKALSLLPKSLDHTYARILDNIDRDDNSRDAFRILQWLAYSAQPLKIEDMVEVIAVDIGGDPQFDPENRLPDPRDILTKCSSLVTTAGAELRLAHFSIEEYLVSDRVPSGYRIAERAHEHIAQTCLTYLLHFKGPPFPNEDSITEFPLARYAAKYWAQHARMAGKNTDRIDWLSMELFQTDAFINWIQIWDPETGSSGLYVKSRSFKSIPPPLYYASREGLSRLARLLLDKGADVNARGGFYDNAIKAASSKDHGQVVQLLLDRGADVNAPGSFYYNALQAASHQGHIQIVHLLLERGAEVNAEGGEFGSALKAAATRGHGLVVKLLLEKGAGANARGGEFYSPLRLAAANSHSQVVKLLLEKGADVNAPGWEFGNVLAVAVAGAHCQVVKLLLENGADINGPVGQLISPLHVASYFGHDQVVKLLLENGAHNNRWEESGSALQAALAEGHDHVARLLIEKGAV